MDKNNGLNTIAITIDNNQNIENNTVFFKRKNYLIVSISCFIVSELMRGVGMYKLNTYRTVNWGYFTKGVFQVREDFIKRIGLSRDQFVDYPEFGVGQVADAVITGASYISNPYLAVGVFAVKMVTNLIAFKEQDKLVRLINRIKEKQRQKYGDAFNEKFYDAYYNLLGGSLFMMSWFVWVFEKLAFFWALYSFVCFLFDVDNTGDNENKQEYKDNVNINLVN